MTKVKFQQELIDTITPVRLKAYGNDSSDILLEKYIYSNENIKDEIIKKYLSAIESAPTLINDSKGAYNIAPKSKPKNIKDAYSIVSELFK